MSFVPQTIFASQDPTSAEMMQLITPNKVDP